MFDLIIDPFITSLTFLYAVFGNNIVIAIVVFTILVRVATYPLTAQQQRSSRAMQEIQPEMKKLQEKHKDDSEKLRQAQMQLYREHGVNPLMGCLPLLIQFPIMIGLYQAILFGLAATPLQLIDLSGRFLIPGLDDLLPLNNVWLGMNLAENPSANPQFALLLPLLVVATSYFQSKLMMPAPAKSDDGKPNQAQAMTQSMTTVMPLMMGFFALSFSTGLSIYLLVSNLVAIGQHALLGDKNKEDTKQKKKLPTKAPEQLDESVAEIVEAEQPGNGSGEPAPQRPPKKKKRRGRGRKRAAKAK